MEKFKNFIKDHWITIVVLLLVAAVSLLFFRECSRNVDVDVRSKGNKVIHNHYYKPPKYKK